MKKIALTRRAKPDRIFNMRLTNPELRRIKEVAEIHGMKPATMCRELLLRSIDTLEV